MEDNDEDGNKEGEDKKDKAEMFTWDAQEVQDCRKDIKELADEIIEQLEARFANCYPERNRLLHHCLDFGIFSTHYVVYVKPRPLFL